MIITSKYPKTVLNWCGKYINSPEQRLIQGATALMIQPVIDLNNKNVDEETRNTSVARTLAKIIAGTAVGVIVRWAGIQAIKAFSKVNVNLGDLPDKARYVRPKTKFDIFVPSISKEELEILTKDELSRQMGRYRKAMGTLIATAAMVITNFAIDAPLTRYLTTKFRKKFGLDSPQEKGGKK